MDLDLVSNQIELRMEKVAHVTSIALFSAGLLLLGKRRDKKTYTLPGGHIENGETPLQGAWRELIEESGIVPDKIEILGEAIVQGNSGKTVQVYAFRAFVDPVHMLEASNRNDPDEEIESWHWVTIQGGLPPEFKANLHNREDVVLRKLGIL